MPVPLTYIQCHHSHARLSQKSTLKGCSLSHQGSREEKSKVFFGLFWFNYQDANVNHMDTLASHGIAHGYPSTSRLSQCVSAHPGQWRLSQFPEDRIPRCLTDANAMDIQWVSIPVHPEDRIPHCPSLPWRVSKIQDCPRIARCPSLPRDANAMDIRWVSIQCHEYPMGIHCPSPAPVHTVPVCLEGCLGSKIVPGFHAQPPTRKPGS